MQGYCKGFLRGFLRALNYLLAIAGLLCLCYAIHMWTEWTRQPPPRLGLSLLPASVGVVGEQNIKSEVALTARAAHDSGAVAGISESSLAKSPWFIYLFGGAGLFLFLTASIGVFSADCPGCTCFLSLYNFLMALLLLMQVGLICYYFFDKSWQKDLPPDTTGEYARLRRLVLHNLRACKVVGIVMLAMQFSALVVSYLIIRAERAQQHIDYTTLDNFNIVTGSSPGGAHASSSRARNVDRGQSEAWQRVQTKYGLEDVAVVDPEQARMAAGADESVAEGAHAQGGACNVM